MKLFEKNVGNSDRIVRFIFAVAFAVVGFYGMSPPWSFLAYAFAVILLFTGAAGTCAAYSLIGINTAKKQAPVAAPKKRKK